MTRFILFVCLFCITAICLQAQDSIPLVKPAPKWSIELKLDGGIAKLPDRQFDYVQTGMFAVNDQAVIVEETAFFFLAPGIRRFTRDINYRKGRQLGGGLELVRKVGLDLSVYSGLGFSYQQYSAGGEFNASSVEFTGGVTDTLMFDLTESGTSVPLCEGEEFPSNEEIEIANRQNAQLGFLNIPVGVRYDFPFLPIRLRAEVSAHTPVFQRFFFRGLTTQMEENCFFFVREERDASSLFAVRKLHFRSTLDADVRLLARLHIGFQVQQQLTSTFRATRNFDEVDNTTEITATHFLPLTFSAVARYALW